MRKREGSIIIWPVYFEKNATRAQGRRLPSNLAAPDVSIEILKKAADSAGFDYEVEPSKRYPRNWNSRSGYIIIDNPEGHQKKRILLMLAKSVRKVVAQRESTRKEKEKKSRHKGKKGRKH